MLRSKSAASTTTYAAIGPSRHQWQPGFQHLPWKGLGALCIALAGVVVSVAILLASNGDDVSRWRFQPTVYLSIASTITNIMNTYALFEGLTVAWWHKALKDGTSLGDLHRVWAFGNSFLSAVWAGRHFNLIALACILVAIAPINGPLLQRASTITNGTVSATHDFGLRVDKLVPKGFTGIVSSRAHTVTLLSTDFAAVAREYYSRTPIHFPSDCVGTCKTQVQGAGFHANCSTYQQPYDADEEKMNPVQIFGANVGYDVGSDPTTVSLGVAYKPEAGCSGKLSVTNCTLKAGTVQYPIVVDGPSSTVSLENGSTIWDDVKVGEADFLGYDEDGQGPTTYGGIFLALANQYNTNLVLQFGGGISWEYYGAQSEASISYGRDIGTYPSCNITFANPMPDFLQGFRELIFRTAVATASSSTTPQQVRSVSSGSHTIYHTDRLFLALATLASLLAILSVLMTFHGFWRIGRVVSMSPIETAKAFHAPLLRTGDSNAPAKDLVKQFGTKPVKYGIVSGTKSSAMSGEGSMYHASPKADAPATAYSPHGILRKPVYRQPSGSDFELLTPEESNGAANYRLELADPKRVTPL